MNRFIIAVLSLVTVASLTIEPIQQVEVKAVEEVTKLAKIDMVVFNNILFKFPTADTEVLEKALSVEVYKDFPKRVDVLAVISTESGFRRCPTDGKGSYGPMQVNLKYHNLTPESVCDPESNIKEGTKILRSYYQMLGSEKAALLAYNAGPANYRNGNYNEGYYEKVLRFRNSLKEL